MYRVPGTWSRCLRMPGLEPMLSDVAVIDESVPTPFLGASHASCVVRWNFAKELWKEWVFSICHIWRCDKKNKKKKQRVDRLCSMLTSFPTINMSIDSCSSLQDLAEVVHTWAKTKHQMNKSTSSLKSRNVAGCYLHQKNTASCGKDAVIFQVGRTKCLLGVLRIRLRTKLHLTGGNTSSIFEPNPIGKAWAFWQLLEATKPWTITKN